MSDYKYTPETCPEKGAHYHLDHCFDCGFKSSFQLAYDALRWKRKARG